MSIRTIVEINHDFSHRADEHPEEFVAAFAWFTSAATPENAERLERFGIRVVETVHHSSDRKVVIEDREYPL